VTEFTNDRTLIQHLQDVGLGNNGERDTCALSQQFVDHVQANEHYQLLTVKL